MGAKKGAVFINCTATDSYQLRTLIEQLAEYVELVPDDRYNAEHLDREGLITEAKRVVGDWDGR